MNMMTSDQRKDATDAALAELLTEMGLWDVDIGDGISIEEYLDKARETNGGQISDKNQRILEIFDDRFGTDQDFSKIKIVDIDKRNGAVTSYNPSNNTYTVSFCGTRADYAEWQGDGIGLSEGSSLVQRNAAMYFDLISSKFGSDAKVVVSGHSNGGNKAMYVTMFSKNRDRIGQCYALDGQSFAKNDIAEMQRHSDYDEQRSKITLIAGENDFVSPFGEKAIEEDQIVYLKDSDRMLNGNDHDVTYMFLSNDGKMTGELASETEQGIYGHFVGELYLKLSENLTEGEFHMTCRVAMDLINHIITSDNVEIADIVEYIITDDDLLSVISIILPHISDMLYHSDLGEKFRSVLPNAFVSDHEMNTGFGAVSMILWYLSLDDDSSFIGLGSGEGFLKTVTNLTKLRSIVKDGLRIRNYPKTSDGYAAQSGYIKAETDEIRLAAEIVNDTADNISSIRGGFNTAFYTKYNSKSEIENMIYAVTEILSNNVQAWDGGKYYLNNASEKLRSISKALSDIANKLEEAEETAEKYGRM